MRDLLTILVFLALCWLIVALLVMAVATGMWWLDIAAVAIAGLMVRAMLK